MNPVQWIVKPGMLIQLVTCKGHTMRLPVILLLALSLVDCAPPGPVPLPAEYADKVLAICEPYGGLNRIVEIQDKSCLVKWAGVCSKKADKQTYRVEVVCNNRVYLEKEIS